LRLVCYTGCVSESGDFAKLFFLVRQQWGGCRYRHFASSFKAFSKNGDSFVITQREFRTAKKV
jgi:hypothetical protein